LRAPALTLLFAAAAPLWAQEGFRFLGDEGHIAVIEHDGGNYDKLTPAGQVNDAPRQALVRRFIQTHGDFYDFVVVFTNFEFERSGATAFYLGVRNDVRGIGTALFDSGGAFGSANRLQGVIDMGPVAQYRREGFSVEPSDPRFRATLGILAHEVGHRWLARVRFLDDGELRSDLLGDEAIHWSYLLSSDASFLYGSRWDGLEGGLYRAAEVLSRYSALDLYLMGFEEPESVPPLLLLRNPDVDPVALPDLGAVVSASEEVVTLDQIREAEGAREPGASSSQKDFRLGFVLLTERDLVPSPLDLAAVDGIRQAFVTTFFSLTKGRGFADTDLSNVIPPAPTTTPDTTLAVDWLLSRQREDGRFEDHPRTSLRDTTVAIETLDLLGLGGEPLPRARSWLSARTLATVDDLSRAVAAGSPNGARALQTRQNADGGFGIASGYRSDPLDTALALLALTRSESPEEPRRRAAEFLVRSQSAAGGWSSIAGSPPDLLATCAAVRALEGAEALPKALAWLVASQQEDGGFGDGPSTPYATACAAEALLGGSAPAAAVDRALEYLGKTQRADGSWEGSVFQTAAVLSALVPASLANLAIRPSDVALDPERPEVGEGVTVSVTVRNRSRVAASAFALEVFDGDPELGGTEIGSELVPSLLAGASFTAAFDWDTAGLQGSHVLFAVADLEGAVPELSKSDNLAMREIDVLPLLPNLVLEAIVSEPASPPEGVSAVLTVRVGSRGTIDSPASRLRIYEGHPSLGLVVADVPVPPLASGSSFESAATWETSGKLGRRRLTAVADSANDLAERFENDNEMPLDLEVRTPPPPEPDLVLEKNDLTLSPDRLTTLPAELSLTANLRNTGANPVPAVRLELYQGNPSSGGILLDSRTVDVPGDGGVKASFTFSVTSGGSRTYFVVLDPNDSVLERSESNNAASIDLVDPMDTIDLALANLTLSSTSLIAGETLVAFVDVTNRGTRRLTAAPVSLFASSILASTASLDLVPGASQRIELTWKANRLGSIVLEARADPGDRLRELDEANNVLSAIADVASSGLANLTVASAEIATAPAPPLEGEPASVSARVRNAGDQEAAGFAVAFSASTSENAIPLGTVAVPSLAPGGEILVSLDWTEVNLRGAIALHVDVDAFGAVPEFDEDDNRTFRVVDVIGLPNLGASTPGLRLEPRFARSGETVAVEATFENRGGREALGFVAEIRLDDPGTGALLGSEVFPLLPPGEIASFSATWDTTGIEGEHAFFLVLDALDSVREQREDDNLLRVAIALQDADLFVTPLYFSPDGNGVQDEALFFYRTESSPVSVEVFDAKGREIRSLVTAGPGTGSAVWDGRTDGGVLARDGDYAFVLAAEGGVELARRRVVLDTNRSSVAEALGTDFAGIANLTCKLGSLPSGPAFPPDDSAAYFIASETGEPEYPPGLYRASIDGSLLEPIATGSAFSTLSFVQRSPSRAQRIVSPDGTRALATSFETGLGLLDLATGALTPFGRFATDARWSPDGARILVSDPGGLYLYSAAGDFVSQISPLGAEVVEWSPDGSRIAYRPSEEMVLHLMNADGTNDRILAATDVTRLLPEEADRLTPGSVALDKLFFTLDGDAVVFSWFHGSSEKTAGPFEIDLAPDELDELTPLEIFDEVSSDQEWAVELFATTLRRFRGRERRTVIPWSAGEELRWSYRDTYLSYRAVPEPGCVGYNRYLVRSLLNGEARFRVTALPSGFGVRIEGSVADRNLDVYRLEYAPVSAPSALVPIQLPSNRPVVNDVITTWIPPGPGDYVVRLTLEDKAGNEVVRLDRVSWSKTLPIASLRRSPPAISPNGDGVRDEALVEYNVLEPANLVFRLRDSGGAIVRTIVRDEAVLGPVSFAWDGTDDSGSRVEDGRYVIEISGAELPVLVDQTPPRVEAAHSDLYTSSTGSLRLAVDLEGLVQDENLERWSLLTSEGDEIADSVRPLGSEAEPALLVEGGSPLQGLEVRASDAAGNETALPIQGPSREVRVVAREFQGKETGIGPFAPGPPQVVPHQSVLPERSFGWSAEASFPPGGLRFVYREERDGESVEVPAGRRLRLKASDFPVGRRFIGSFESHGVRSQEVSFTVGPDAIFVDVLPALSAVRIVQTIEEELVEGELFLTIGGEGRVLRTYRPVPRSDEISLPDIPCGAAVSLRMEATGASGKRYRSTTVGAYPKPAAATFSVPGCLSVDDVGISSQASPEAELPKAAVAQLFHDLEEAPESVALLLSNGTSVEEVARVAPGERRAPFDVASLPEGSYSLSARADIPGGGTLEGDFGLRFLLDQSPPSAAIPIPAEGASACVVHEDGLDWVELEVAGSDGRVSGFAVELQNPSGAWEPVMSKPRGLAPAFPRGAFQSRVLARIPEDLEGSQRFRLVVSSDRIVQETAGRPPRDPSFPPAWPNPLNNGSILGTAVRNLVIVRRQSLTGIAVDPALFSPSGDGILDETRVRGELEEAASLTVRVHPLKSPALVRTVVEGSSRGAGPFEVVWDGRDESGQFVADGEYRIEVVAVNGCGATSKAETRVEVDRTPPTVAIVEPGALAPVATAVEVRGTATDRNFDRYRLEFGETESPSAFEPIGPPVATPVPNGLLGVWKTGELREGIHTLRLAASDRAGNEDSVSVVVDVRAPDLIESVAAEPSVFSPNGDGVKDGVELRFRLKTDAVVTLRILRPDDTEVAALLLGESRARGDHSVTWTGPAPDGMYRAHFSARDALLPAVSEEASLALILDTEAPAIQVTAPVEGAFVALPSAVFGSIYDQNLERYTIDLGPENGALSRLEENGLNSSGEIASLVGLTDGGYRLSIQASDLAGNATAAEIRFTADSTKPVVAIQTPAPGAHLQTSRGAVSVTGRVIEANLESHRLELGSGSSPSVFVTLATGSSPELEVPWDVGPLPDGVYTLRLHARDEAGSSAETSHSIVLDGTKPAVAIETPAEGAFAGRESRVLGSARDPNFVEAVLAISREDAPFQEIARFDSEVVDGILKDGLPFEDGRYRLSLTAKDIAGNESRVERSFAIDTEPPAAPQGVGAQIEARTSVRLSWLPNGEGDLAGYRVFRDGTLLTPAPILDPFFVDSGRPEGRFRYEVVAVDRAGLESETSAKVEVRIDLTPPLAILRSPDEGARVRGLVDVVGTAFSESDFQEYRLSVAPGSNPESPTLLRRSPLPVNFQTLVQWEAVALEGAFILILEAEDVAGNVATDSVRVFVDNEAPPPPVLTSVTPASSPEDVSVAWEPSSAPDVSGYLVFRNGDLANAPEGVSGDLRPFLVPGPSYLDSDLPDGRFCYRVAAMDQAGNSSFDSNELCVVLDNRTPRALLVEPEDGARFDRAPILRAISEDEDLASVLFQYQPVGSAVWSDVGIDGDLPFEIPWDIAGLAFGDYRLRAVATDASGRTDPAPASIGVVLGDATAPPAPGSLVAVVDSDSIALTWDAVDDSGLAGYRLYRDGALVATLGAVTETLDASRPDGVYAYQLSAFDSADNESPKTDAVSARVYRPALLPSFPVFEGDTVGIPGERAVPGARVDLFLEGSPVVLAEATADADGRFLFESVALALGESLLECRATDPAGNRSRLAEAVFLARNEPPSAPSGLEGIVNGDSAELSWSANSEIDLAGYLVKRDSGIVSPMGRIGAGGEVPSTLTASASSSFSSTPPGRAIDGSLSTYWASAIAASFTSAWLDVRLSPARHVREVKVEWGFNAARDFRLLAEVSGRLVPLAVVRGNSEDTNAFALPFALRTERIRIETTALRNAGGRWVEIREVELSGLLPLTATSAVDTPDSSGIYRYGVSAIDVLGGLSPESTVELPVGDVTPPEPPVDLVASVSLADVTLSWTASSSTDAGSYRLYRDGAAVALVTGTTYLDPSLPDGLYRYQVAALDLDQNEGGRSNEVTAEVSVDSPIAPLLSVEAVPEGRALRLSWTASSGPLGVGEYSVLRSKVAGGPFAELSRLDALTLVDTGLANGVTYFYVVRALDPRGEVSPDSNEASGTPTDTSAPPAPVFTTPTIPGVPVTLTKARTSLAGRAEPGSRVRVESGAGVAGEADAAASLLETRVIPIATVDGASQRIALSPDRMSLAEVGFSEIRIWSFETGALQTVPFDLGGEFPNGIAFSPDGGRLAVAVNPVSRSGSLRIVDLGSGSMHFFSMSGEVGWPEWIGNDSLAVAIGRDIHRLTPSTGASERIYTGLPFSPPPSSLRLSPGASRLAFVESWRLVVLDLSTRQVRLISGSLPSGFNWVSDETIALSDYQGIRLSSAVSAVSTLVPETAGMLFPSPVGPGEIAAVSGAEVFLVGERVESMGVLPLGAFDVLDFAATGDFRVVVFDSALSRARLFSLPGRFEIPDVTLLPGKNLFTAVATDADANESPPSDAIEITFEDGGLPDLVLEAPIVVIPAVPSAGEVASVSLAVRNAGLSAAGPGVIQLVADTGGNLATVASEEFPALSPGEPVPVTLAFRTAGFLGSVDLVAIADPFAVIDEKDETNNSLQKTVTVVGRRGVGLAVSTVLPSYAPRQGVEIRVEAVQGGDSSELALETVIEDAQGAPVAVVDRRAVFLKFGEATAYTVSWNTGTSLAGIYRVRASASPDAVATADFEIRRLLDVDVTVASARPSYVQGDSVSFLASVSNRGSNAPLRSLTLRFSVGGVFEAFASVPYLAMGASASASALWPRADSPPGTYAVELSVLEGDQVLASATGAFEILPAIEVELEGSLSLERSEVAEGVPIVARFEIENVGVLPLSGGIARLELLDPRTGQVTFAEEFEADVLPGETLTGEASLDTTGQGLGRRSVLLAAGATLAAAPLTLFAVPAPPSLNSPAEGSPAPQPLRLSVGNATNPNAEALTYEFEIYLDEALQALIGSGSGIPEGTNATPWNVPLTLPENQRYFWRARARDRFASSDWMPKASFFADTVNDPPSAPSLSSPAEATEVDTRTPVLAVVNGIDPEKAPLDYAFEIYSDAGLAELVVSLAPVPEGEGETAVSVSAPLDEDRDYYWRARARDGELESDWMPAARFRVNTGNHAPAPPSPRRPVSMDVQTSTPELAAVAGLDPEGEAVSHRFEIDESPSFDSPALQVAEGLFAAGEEVHWTPTSPLVENRLYFWRIRASDGSAASGWSGIARFRIDVENEAPSIPRVESPLAGAMVETATPSLALVNAVDPEEDSLRYDFEVYRDEALSVLAASIASVREGEGRTVWVVSPRLEEDETYHFRARASDGELASPWSPAESFLVNTINARPSSPSLSSPADGSLVAEIPVILEVGNALDPDGDALSYRFELYRDVDLVQLVEASNEVPGGSERTSWEVPAALVENETYYWRARAADGRLEGAWMPTARFRFSLDNESPTPPVLLLPEDGARVLDSRPLLTIENASDPDGDQLRYVFEVYSDAGLTELVERATVEEGSAGTAWRPSSVLEENKTYFWRVLATDGARTTESEDVFQLVVDAIEEAPLAPTPLEPPNGATIATRAPTLVVVNSVNPDGRPLLYRFELYASDLVASDEIPEGQGETRWQVPVELVPGATYSWRARSIDDRGLASEWSESWTFTVEAEAPSCPPEWREVFETAGPDGLPAGWRVWPEGREHVFRVEDGRLVSRPPARWGETGFIFFEGNGEAREWRNYQFEGVLGNLERPLTNAGVAFYASEMGEYLLLISTSPAVQFVYLFRFSPEGPYTVLDWTSVGPPFIAALDYHIEVANEANATSIRARIRDGERTFWLDGVDRRQPLRGGTVGAVSIYAKAAAWDEMRVRPLPGYESAMSGDADGDGDCDVPSCGETLEVCLDEGGAVVGVSGSVDHAGPTACGELHSYRVSQQTGTLLVETPSLEGGSYELRLLLHQGKRDGRPVVRVSLESGASFDVSTLGTEAVEPFFWSEPHLVALPPGVSRFQIRSLIQAPVAVEAFRLVPECPP
jgi:subtilase family serine protease/flagellar hook assembly protein FlgD